MPSMESLVALWAPISASSDTKELANELKVLVDQTSIETPNIDKLIGYIP